ncbi:SNF1-related protein kinase catalytic subunit alpha KIN10 [Platanthera guangdongensis]|uniref:SNF1-related protein kinase catalytic subunit alpha KIN10 n=1 Tax=Platanthera guangdongensis TaxID=2320717 RepID=A0ABR2MB10_9ASPA
MNGGSTRGNTTAELILVNNKLGKTLRICSFGKVKIAEHALTGYKAAIKPSPQNLQEPSPQNLQERDLAARPVLGM